MLSRQSGFFINLKIKSMPKKLLLGVLFFLAFNITVFCTSILKNTINRPYTIAKINLSISKTINNVYYIPFSQVMGAKNPLLIPVYDLRNYFYKNGLKSLPKDDAEREIWWSYIELQEYLSLYEPTLRKFVRNEISRDSIDSNFYIGKTNEIYDHIKLLYDKKKLLDKEFRLLRYQYYVDLSWLYLSERSSLIYLLKKQNGTEDSVTRNNPFLKNIDEIQKIQNILNWYLRYRVYAIKEEKEGYNKFIHSNNWVQEHFIVNRTSLYILMHKIISQALKCDDPIIELYNATRNVLINKVNNSHPSIKYVQHLLYSDQSSFVLDYINLNCKNDLKNESINTYIIKVRKKLQANWSPAKLNKKYMSSVKFSLDRSGNVLEKEIIQSANDSNADFACLNAISKSAPFPLFPSSYKKDKIYIQYKFEYTP